MIAQSLLDHPEVAHYLRYSARTDGCDKLLRTCQYTCRFLLGSLRDSGYSDGTTIASLDGIKVQFGLARKWLGAGRFVEHLLNAIVLYDARPGLHMDRLQQWLNIGRQVGYAIYLGLDSVTYVDLLWPRQTSPSLIERKLHRMSLRGWLMALTCSVTAGVYALGKLNAMDEKLDSSESRPRSKAKDAVRSQRKDIGLQLLTDFFDLVVLSSALGYSNFGEPLLGFSGTMSGAIGAWRVWQKTASP